MGMGLGAVVREIVDRVWTSASIMLFPGRLMIPVARMTSPGICPQRWVSGSQMSGAAPVSSFTHSVELSKGTSLRATVAVISNLRHSAETVLHADEIAAAERRTSFVARQEKQQVKAAIR